MDLKRLDFDAHYGSEPYHLVYDPPSCSYNLPFRYDLEAECFLVEKVEDDSHTAWALLATEPHTSRMNRAAKAVGRIYACTQQPGLSGLVPQMVVSGFYVAPNIIMSVHHIIKSEPQQFIFSSKWFSQWRPNTPMMPKDTTSTLTLIASNDVYDVSLWHTPKTSHEYLPIISSRVLDIPEDRLEAIKQNSSFLIEESPAARILSSVFCIGYNGYVTQDMVDSWNSQAPNLVKKQGVPSTIPRSAEYNLWLQPDSKTCSPGNIVLNEDGILAVTCSYVGGYCGSPLLFVTEADM